MTRDGILEGAVETISNDDHFLMVNPNELLFKIVMHLFGEEESQKFAKSKEAHSIQI